MAALALVAIIVGSLGVAALFDAIAPGDTAESVMQQVILIQDYDIAQTFGLVFMAGGVMLLFASAVFFSTFLSRAMTAAAAGVVTSLGIVSLIFVVWSRFDLMPRFEPGLVAVELGAASMLILLASLNVFARGEMLSGRGVLRYATLGLLAAIAGLVVVSVPAFVAHMRLTSTDAVLIEPKIVPTGNAVVTTAVGLRRRIGAELGRSSSMVVATNALSPRLTGRPFGLSGR